MSRIQKVQEKIEELGLDAFLVLTKINRQYLCGFTGSAGILLVTIKSATLFVDPRYFLRAKKETNIRVKPQEQYSHILKNVRISKVGIEDRILLQEFIKLKSQRVKWKVTHEVIEDLRAQKNSAELTAIKKGSKIIDQVFERVKKVIKGKRSISEAEIAFFIEKEGKQLGAEGLAFEPIVAFGPNASSPHHATSTRKIGKNNFLLLDYGFKVNGYHSDFTRTLFIGRPNKIQEKIYNLVLNAQAKGIKTVKIGLRAEEVHTTVYNSLKAAGFSRYFTHNTGHGVGLEIHESPSLAYGVKNRLIKNSVVTVEPGVYLPGKFGVRIEDMVWVRKKPEVLSKIPKDLASMTINF